MAKKTYLIKQQVEILGKPYYASSTVEMEPADIAAVVAQMDGQVKVLVEDTTLSTAEGVSKTVDTTNLIVDTVVSSMDKKGSQKAYFGPYDKKFVFKPSASVVGLQTIFKLHKPFIDADVSKFPDIVIVRTGDITELL
jgi:hypothetical protein